MDLVTEGRRAHAEQRWPEAFEFLEEASHSESLTADDHSALADSAWWLAKLDESIAARERAYEARIASGDIAGAALEAFSLALALGDKGADAAASGWRSRARDLAAQQTGTLASGYILSMDADDAFHAGAIEDCIEKATKTIEIGKANDDPTLVAWATHLQGLAYIKQGSIDKGWGKLDESMIAATTTRLKPKWTGLMHCGMLLACEEFGDPRRGWQWVEATERWLGTVPGAVLYPGVCRVHKVHIMQLRGKWPAAEAEARRACEELIGVHIYTAARGYYEIAEIKRLTGDLDAALELYTKANDLGFDPQPGLARLRLAQGRTDAALAGLRRALDEVKEPSTRARLLPHRIDVALAAGELEAAAADADELTAISNDFHSPMMLAAAAYCRGAVLLDRADPQAALTELRRATSDWMHLDCLYEVARSRTLVGVALEGLGDDDGAELELSSARAIFASLGAEPDAQRVSELMHEARPAGGLSSRELEVLRLVTEGDSNKEIAARLFISENTVARHLQNIFAKLNVGSRAAATSVALKRGLT